jgi:hypothetical protein
MSSTRPPVRRPLPPGVYRRRRLMVGVTAVLLVVATVDLLNGDDGAPADAVQQVVGTPTGSPTATAPAVVPVGPTKGRRRPSAPSAPVTTAPAPAPAPAEPQGRCADSDVMVRPEVPSAVAGSRVVVTLALSTRESEACTWSVSDEHLALKILDDDGGNVWSSSDCPDQVRSGSVVVRRDLISTYRLAWNGQESSRDCPTSMPVADPGRYAVQAAAIGGEPSAVVPFELVDPSKVEPPAPVGPPAPKTKKSGTRSKARSR